MSARVTSVHSLEMPNLTYSFIVSSQEEFSTPLERAFNREWKEFGDHIGAGNWIFRLSKPARRSLLDELLKRSWPRDICHRINNDDQAFMVLTPRTLAQFDPAAHDWAIMWLNAFSPPEKKLPRLFEVLAREVTARPEHLMHFLRERVDGRDPLFPRGSLSVKNAVEHAPERPRRGRPRIVSPALREALPVLYRDTRPQCPEKGWKTALARSAKHWLAQHGQPRTVKAIRDALRDEGVFGDIERAGLP